MSGNLRSQFARRRRALEREGGVVLRTGSAERDLDQVLHLEGSGWKRRAGTAVMSNPRTEAFYRDFAGAAEAQGWLRLYLLELDGRPIAADYGCAFGGTGFLLKTGFDERYARLSPGLVLRGEVLRTSIEEGLPLLRLLGRARRLQAALGGDLRPRVTIWGYRSLAAPAYLYRARLRGRLKRALARYRRARDRDDQPRTDR